MAQPINRLEDPQIKRPRPRPIALTIGTTVIFPAGDTVGELSNTASQPELAMHAGPPGEGGTQSVTTRTISTPTAEPAGACNAKWHFRLGERKKNKQKTPRTLVWEPKTF